MDESGAEDTLLRALWLQEVTRRGVLVISTHNISAALTRRDVEHILQAYAGAFKFIEAWSLMVRTSRLISTADTHSRVPSARMSVPIYERVARAAQAADSRAGSMHEVRIAGNVRDHRIRL